MPSTSQYEERTYFDERFKGLVDQLKKDREVLGNFVVAPKPTEVVDGPMLRIGSR